MNSTVAIKVQVSPPSNSVTIQTALRDRCHPCSIFGEKPNASTKVNLRATNNTIVVNSSNFFSARQTNNFSVYDVQKSLFCQFKTHVTFIIMQNYTKTSVMELAIPVAVRFLHQENKELCRNISSYLSLAAIDNSHLLAQNVIPIIDSCATGM